MGWNHQPVNLYHKGNPFMIGVAGWVLTERVGDIGVFEFTTRLNTVDGWNLAPPGMYETL